MALAVGAAGIATGAIHGAVLASGAAASRTLPSLALIAAAAGIALVLAALRGASESEAESARHSLSAPK